MKFGRLLILLAAAGSGAAVYKVRHPEDGTAQDYQYQQDITGNPQDESNVYDALTGDGSLLQTLQHAKQEREQQTGRRGGLLGQSQGRDNTNDDAYINNNPNYSAGGIGKVGGAGIQSGRYGSSSYGSNARSSGPVDDYDLLQAAAKGDKLTVQRRIAANVKIDSRDDDRRTPLMYAAANGFEDIIDRLVAAGANPNFKDRNGNNVFDYAAGRGLVETVQYLLNRTHTPDDRHYVEYAQTIRAAYAGDPSLLPPGTGKLVSVNRINHEGQAPLHIAAGNGAAVMINALLARGAEVNLTNSNQQTPLHWAAWNNQVGSAQALLAKGACVYQGEAAGNTPLMLAAQSNSKEVAQVLIENGAELDVVNKMGKTAAMQAEDRGYRDLSNMLK